MIIELISDEAQHILQSQFTYCTRVYSTKPLDLFITLCSSVIFKFRRKEGGAFSNAVQQICHF